MKKSDNLISSNLPLCEDDFFISFELVNASTAQLLYYRAVVLPELEDILRKHSENLMELGK